MAERVEPVPHVVGVGVGDEDPLEQLARPGELTRALHQIGEDVPLPQVALCRVADRPGGARTGQERDRTGEIAAVRAVPCEHKPALGEDLRIRRSSAQLVVEVLDAAVPAYGALAVHPDRVLVDRAGQPGEGLEVREGGSPVPLVVLAEAEQLAGEGASGTASTTVFSILDASR